MGIRQSAGLDRTRLFYLLGIAFRGKGIRCNLDVLRDVSHVVRLA